jgi:hypothetical protein
LFVCDETRFITENHPTWVINDEPNKLEFEAYSNGEYAINHTNCYVVEQEVL